MASPSDEIRSATPDELPQVVSCIVAAFLTDPISRFSWPSAHDYLHGMPLLAAAMSSKSAEHASLLVSDDCSGAALWLPPGVRPDEEAMAAIPAARPAKPEHAEDLGATFTQMGQAHPEAPHWYLPILGVEPNAQGRGLGGALMRHAIARFDDEGALAYLESSNPRNISLYERHGFEVMGQIQVGAGPIVTPMQRQPR